MPHLKNKSRTFLQNTELFRADSSQRKARMFSQKVRDKLTLVVIGRSGCGKGTQAKLMLERLQSSGVFHMETGRFLRELLEKKNVTTELARTRIMDRGELFPWWFPMFLWLREMIERGESDKHLVGDGTPRRLSEAKFLDDVMAWHDRALPIAVYIEVSKKIATERLLSRGRADDRISAIRNRMKFFPKDVLPVIRYYRAKNRLIRVNGADDPKAVWRDIDQALAKKLGRQWPRA